MQNAASSVKSPSSPSAWAIRIITLVAAGLVIVFYLWTSSSAGDPFELGAKKNDYYNLLADGFLSGHLYLALEPDPRLLASDPAVRRQAPFPLDASFYQGHFYLYFGITPLLLVFLPWKLVGGHGIPENLAAALFAITGFLLAVALLNRLRRRHFPTVGPITWLVVVLTAGFCTVVPAALRHAIFYEVAVCAAFASAMLFFFAATRALENPNQAGRWLLLAGTAYALAVGARANLIFSGILLVILGWAVWRRQEPRSRSFPNLFQCWLAAGLPAVLGLAGLMLYNYQRFNNPLEFGLSYQLGSNPHGFPFKLPFLWHNLRLYFFALPEFGRYFPFFAPGLESSRPAGYWGIEQVHSQFFFVLLLIPIGAGAFLLRPRWNVLKPLGWLFSLLLAWTLINGLLISLTGVRADRYLVDFLPEIALLASVALMAISEFPGGRSRWIWSVTTALLLVGSFYNAMASFQLEGYLRTINPRSYARLVHAFDLPAWLIQKAFGDPSGALRLQVIFPPSSPNAAEPLVTTGTSWFSDTLYVHYLKPGVIELGFDHVRYGGLASDPISIIPGQPYSLVVHMGSLYPPAGDPSFDGLDAVEHHLKRTLRVELDGKTVLATLTNFYDASPGQVRLGNNPLWPSTYTGHFTGRIVNLGREHANLAELAARTKIQIGPLAMQIKFPSGMTGTSDPLIASGQTGRADLLYVHYVDASHVSFGLDHWGYGTTESPPIAINYGEVHSLEADLGSLYPPDVTVPALLRRLLLLKLDGHLVFCALADFYPVSPLAVEVGANDLGASTCHRSFGGPITNVRRLGTGSVRHATQGSLEPQIIRIHVSPLPPGHIEPWLAALDQRGSLVVALMQWDKDQTVKIGLVRNQTILWSAPLRLDPQQKHELMLGLSFSPSSVPPALTGWAEYAQHRWTRGLRLYVDGDLLIQDPTATLIGTPDTWAWLVPIAGQHDRDPKFSPPGGFVILNRRPALPFLSTAPADWNTRGGRLQLDLSLPTSRASQTDPLLTCGRPGQGDALFIEYLDDQHIRFGLDHWGVGAFYSPPLPVDYATPALLDIRWDPPHQSLGITLNGRVVWRQTVPLYQQDGNAVCVGSNPLGFSSCGRYFQGEILRTSFAPGAKGSLSR